MHMDKSLSYLSCSKCNKRIDKNIHNGGCIQCNDSAIPFNLRHLLIWCILKNSNIISFTKILYINHFFNVYTSRYLATMGVMDHTGEATLQVHDDEVQTLLHVSKEKLQQR